MEVTVNTVLLLFASLISIVHSDYKVCVSFNQEDISSESVSCSKSLSNLDEITQLQLSSAANTVILVNSTVLSKMLTFDSTVNLTIEGILSTDAYHDIVPTVTCKSTDSGLYFSRIQGLTVKNLAFVGCGALQDSTTTDLLSPGRNQTAKFKSALYIWMCTNVKIMNIRIHQSDGLGMAIFDTNGTVIVNGSSFKQNQMLSDTYIGGGGIYIEFTRCPPGVLYGTCETSHDYKLDSQYEISYCTFESNRAYTSNPEKSSFVKLVGVKKLINFQGLGRGGGLAIRILGSASRNRISIVDCKFYHNQALSGGGLNIKIADEANKNSVKIISCRFAHNT